MRNETTVIERAFEIARGGTVAGMTGLRARLKLEGYEGVEAHLSGSPSLSRQLIRLLREAQHRRQAEADAAQG